MSKMVRNTKKSRMVAEFCEAIVDRYCSGDYAISKSEIVADVVDNNVGSETSTTIRTMLEDELANELERYFYDSVTAAAAVIDRPHHLVTQKFFQEEKVGKSKFTEQQKLATFGNGRTGKAAGVRFIPEGVVDDTLYMLSLEKRIDTTNATINTRTEALKKDLDSGAVPALKAGVIKNRLPHSGDKNQPEAG